MSFQQRGTRGIWFNGIVIQPERRCPRCGHLGQLRPYIVWSGEMPLEMDRIFEALEGCGLFIAIGTLGTDYPTAGFVDAVPSGARDIEVNLEISAAGSRFKERRQGAATERVPERLAELMK